MCGCNETTKDCILRYTGETIDCLGIEKNELMETVVQTLAEAICAEQDTSNVCCNEIVMYSENELGINSISLSPTISVMAGTSYTVPTGEDGLYSIEYIGDVSFGNDGMAEFIIYKNNSAYNTILNRTITAVKNFTIPFTLKANNISLAAGDTIDVRATRTGELNYANNAVFTLIKLS